IDITEKTELELNSAITNLKRFDYIIMPAVTLIAAVWTFFYVGISIEWDDLFYMNLSQYTTKQGWVLNRYGHVYLQKIFMFLLNDAIAGAKAYWCFLFFSTSLLVYYCAKLISDKKSYLVAVISMLFFISQPLFAHYAGCTFADITIMFLSMLGMFIYLGVLCDDSKHRNWFIFLLGMIFLWAVKSKETGICLAPLFLSLGQDSSGSRSFKRFITETKFAITGILSAYLILMLCDLVFMGDFFFSLRPSSWNDVLGFNFRVHPKDKPMTSWYSYISSLALFGPFLLYIIAGCKLPEKDPTGKKAFAWLVPLVVLFFLGFIRGRWHIVPRYIAPIIAGVCVWAGQFFEFDFKDKKFFEKLNISISKKLIAVVFAILAFIVLLIIMSKVPHCVKTFRVKDEATFYSVAIMPFAVTLLLAVSALSKKRGFTAWFFTILAFFMLIYFPLTQGLKSLKNEDVKNSSEWRYQPYKSFGDQLRFDKDVKILISKDIYSKSWMLGRDDRSHCWMFNIFFNKKFEYEQFIDAEFNDITALDYTFAFLTFDDWNKLSENKLTAQLQQKYEIKTDKNIGIVFLKKR
ncbi:MAG TPA: hypothetical protein PLP05_07760, partial [Sedimentisphaerales bacterium]|nr:hypothetical protein [Sedimentisphaerales bacterium]